MSATVLCAAAGQGQAASVRADAAKCFSIWVMARRVKRRRMNECLCVPSSGGRVSIVVGIKAKYKKIHLAQWKSELFGEIPTYG